MLDSVRSELCSDSSRGFTHVYIIFVNECMVEVYSIVCAIAKLE